MNRRDFLESSTMLALAASAAQAQAPVMPLIRLGRVEVSRFILGSNPFFGYAHQPGNVGKEMAAYYTDEKIVEVMEEAGRLGVTTVVASPEERWRKLWRRYRDEGGRLTRWIAQCHRKAEDIPTEIREAHDAGCSALFIQGHRVEGQFEGNTFGLVKTWVAQSLKLGLPTGLAAHRPDVHPTAESLDFGCDFYFQCFYNVAHGDTFDPAARDRAIETIRSLPKPCIGYKLLAAGRNDPAEAFGYARRHLRPTDGFCVGIYTRPRPGELVEDVRLGVG